MSTEGLFITLTLEQYPFGFNHRALRIILILIDAALVTGLRTLTAGAKDLGRNIHLNIGANSLVCQRAGTAQCKNRGSDNSLHII